MTASFWRGDGRHPENQNSDRPRVEQARPRQHTVLEARQGDLANLAKHGSLHWRNGFSGAAMTGDASKASI